MFENEVDAYCKALNIKESSIEIDEFEIISLTDKADIFFESNNEDNSLSLKPTIKCYVHPKNEALKIPELVGVAYDSTTIIWSWPEDEQYAHYLIEEAIDPNNESDKSKIIAQLPIGTTSYTETGLEPNTSYTRRLINYTDEQTSTPSPSVTVMTETVEVSQSLEEYTTPKNYDFTTNDSEREIIEERLPAFHSGIGDCNDLKVYKQMDADFYQKFKAYLELTGKRIQREKRYEQVGFNYKVCLEAEETIEEQEGEITFDIDVYPREQVIIENYMWTTHPVDVKTRLTATVFLRKEMEMEEVEEVQLWKPAIKQDPIYSAFAKKTAIIISVDMSSSMRQIVEGTPRYVKVQKATCALVDAIETKARENEAYTNDLIQYIIVGWATNAEVKYNGYSANDAKAVLRSMTYVPGGCTCWYKGLTKGKSVVASDREAVGQIFFTDGFVNTDENGHFAYTKDSTYASSVINSISKSKRDAGCDTYFVFGNGAKHVDEDYGDRNAGIEFAKDKIVPKTKEVFGDYCYYPGYNSGMDKMSETRLAKKLIKGLKIFRQEIVGYQNEFEGWEESEESAIVKKYNIDDVKAVTITTDIFNFTFDNNVTPVVYSRYEKRAIIPATNFLPPTKLSDKSIYDIIMDKVKETVEWAAGYNQTIGTVEADNESDKFLIKGLFIQDSYRFADEDEIIEDSWNDIIVWENGMNGSVTTFTDIDKAGTTTYGDDCYLVSQNNYLMIQGYTDAIIYDYTRFINTELNAYDHSSEILISSAVDIYDNLLINRKKQTLTYADVGGTNPASNVVDVIRKDKDIYLTGHPGLTKEGDWLYFETLTEDLIANNDTIYKSPILNYRFNLEDPSSKIPLYEILPDSNIEDNFLNIVILHVYYAKNVYITNKDNYVEHFGADPIATTSSEYISLTENLYKWTLRESENGIDNGWYIDEYLWFMSKPMKKTRDYYDELPGHGIDNFYGLVNGKYRSNNQNGKCNLKINVPQFNIPTTVNKDTIKIYITITKCFPDSALVSYKWENPFDNKNDITQVNGDYVTFSSDNLTYKDIEYIDVISTINMEDQEVFDQKTTERIFEISKPNTVHEYTNYYLEITTDNSDVLAMRYPTEIVFDEKGLATISAAFKGVVNATSQWAPRIHNGYYYLNQHEYFAYSEFNVEANFDNYEETNFKTANGYVTFDVQLKHKANPIENYSIIKSTRSELLQDEEQFQWIDGKGLTLRPYANGKYYKEYLTYVYYSPVFLFDNILTEAGPLKVDYIFEDGSDYLPMEIRSYNIEEGKWSDWTLFNNNTIPAVPLSCGYQVRFNLQASVQNKNLYLEDYMCCYLDWKEDMDETNTTNIVTITDHMTTGPDNSQGIYVSKILDFGCETELMLDIFESYYKDSIKIYLGYSSNDADNLLLENITWNDITQLKNTLTKFKARYFRYKIVIPAGEKLYWLHKKIQTLETEAMLPYITNISMTGKYTPNDVVTNFINTESFEIPKDGNTHTVFNKISDVIKADVLEKGYTIKEIEYIKIQCTSKDIEIQYDENLNNKYPFAYLDTAIEAKSNIDVDIVIKNTPYIFVEKDEQEKDGIIKIIGTPQQYCPITVEDIEGNSYIQLHDTTSFVQEETYLLTEETKYIELKSNRYDTDFKVFIDDEELDIANYRVINHLVIFNDFIGIGHTVRIEYCLLYSFIAVVDRPNNTTTIYLHPGKDVPMPEKCKVYFETSTKNNKFIAQDLSLNPIYRTDYKGFIYLTDEHNEPYEIKIHCNPCRLKAGGFDKVDVAIEVLDVKSNPVVAKDVAVDCEYGILNCESYETDINGVIHLVYESAYLKCTDTLTARVRTDDGTLIGQTITIINE